jgi:hypothetical protein
MKKFIALIFTACTLILAGCCTAHHVSEWEYKTLVTPNDAVPLEDTSKGWVSKDETLNAMLKQGWMVAGYGVDHMNSQWFLLEPVLNFS